jgi:hypothetical protein
MRERAAMALFAIFSNIIFICMLVIVNNWFGAVPWIAIGPCVLLAGVLTVAVYEGIFYVSDKS